MKTLLVALILAFALALPGCIHKHHHHNQSVPENPPVTIDPPPADEEEDCHKAKHPNCKKCCNKKHCPKDHENED